MPWILALGLLIQVPAQEAPPPAWVAVLASGRRVPCGPGTAPGDRLLVTPWGRLDASRDPVAQVEDASREAERVRRLRDADLGAWAAHVSARGLLGELAAGTRAWIQAHPGGDASAALTELEAWGRRLRSTPEGLEREAAVEWLWEGIPGADPVQAALWTGELESLLGRPGASTGARIGLAELRRALRDRPAPRRRAAARVAARQGERDLEIPLVQASLLDPRPEVRRACAEAVHALQPARALGRWTVALWKGDREEERVHAAEYLGEFGSPEETVRPLILALAQAARTRRPPASHIFVGRQISYVGDFDVQVAQAAVIADPVVRVAMEGALLDVRIHSTTTTRAVMRSLRRLTGRNPGPREMDWLRWYREQEDG